MPNEEAVVPVEDVTEQVNPEESPDAKAETAGEDADPQGTPKQGDSEHDKPKRLGGWQRKIQKLEAQIKQMEQGQKPEAPKSEPSKPKPKLESFSTIEEYYEALTDWKTDQKLSEYQKEQEKKAEAAKRAAEEREVRKVWTEKVSRIKSEHADFEDAVQEVDAAELHPAIQTAIAKSPQGPEMAYHLGTNPDELDRIASLDPAAALFELGKMAARIAGETKAETEKPEPPKTKASKPITPVTKSASTDKFDANDPKWAEKLPADEWMRLRNADLAKRGMR